MLKANKSRHKILNKKNENETMFWFSDLLHEEKDTQMPWLKHVVPFTNSISIRFVVDRIRIYRPFLIFIIEIIHLLVLKSLLFFIE